MVTKYNDFLAQAKDILAQRENTYGKYKEHVKLVNKMDSLIWKNLENSLEETIRNRHRNIPTSDEIKIIDNTSHLLALKFARIINAIEHEDSYIDVIGYLLLFLQNTRAKFVKLRSFDFLPQEHALNQFISFINESNLNLKD